MTTKKFIKSLISHYFILITALICLSSNMTFASEPKDWKLESDIPIEKCDISTISSFYYSRNLLKQAEYSNALLPLIEEQMKLVDKVPNKKRSVGEQFTKEQYSKFNKNREKQITISLQQLLESNRSRDVEVLEHMVQIADKNFRFNSTILDPNHTDYFYQKTLDMLRALETLYPNETEIQANPRECSIDLALLKMQHEVASILGKAETVDLINNLAAFKSSHGGKDLDITKLNKSERKYYDEMANKVTAVMRALQFTSDIVNIILFNQSSIQIYKSGKRDFELYADSELYGKTLKELKASLISDKRAITTLNLIQQFNDTHPSEVYSRANEMAKYNEQNTKNK